MQKIKQLPLHEAQKIAAGEVVERPANVVKELVENALDAGANQITIFLEDAGQTLIRVVDNGCGMSVEDASLCFAQYATSKISSINDLATINTFGFRGEALASIAAVSLVNLVTKEESAEYAIKLKYEESTIKKQDYTSSPTGTDISIYNLFYNVPARKKFLKSPDTEMRTIMQVLYAFCLDYLSVNFKVYSQEKLLLNCSPVHSLIDRMVQLWEYKSDNFVEFEQISIRDTFSIQGIASKQHHYRYDRSQIFFFVNNRWIKNHTLTKALLKSYHAIIPADRYPTACLKIAINTQELDINIHPRKEEIQFLHPKLVEQAITSIVKKQLEEAHCIKETSQHFDTNFFVSKFSLAHEEKNIELIQNPKITTPIMHQELPFNIRVDHNISNMKVEDISSANITKITKKIMAPEAYNIIGNYFNTYILVEQHNSLLFIDQHAAHERILYEHFAHKFEQIESIPLLFPQQILLSNFELQVIEPYLELLASYGIVAEIFGKEQIIIKSVPVPAKHINFNEIIKDIVAHIVQQQLGQQELLLLLHEKLRAQMACKAAIKAGDYLATEQMQQLIKDLFATENYLTCPHGRPTTWALTHYEIEKKFKRA